MSNMEIATKSEAGQQVPPLETEPDEVSPGKHSYAGDASPPSVSHYAGPICEKWQETLCGAMAVAKLCADAGQAPEACAEEGAH